MYKLIIKNSKNPFNNVLYIEHNRKIIDFIDFDVPTLLNTYADNVTKKIQNRKLHLDKVTNRDIYNGKIEEYVEFIEKDKINIEVNIENDPSLLMNDHVMELHSIEEVKTYIKKLIPIAQSLLGTTHIIKYMGCLEKNTSFQDQMSIYEINEDDYDMLVNQLVFDLLSEYYYYHTEKISRHSFAQKITRIAYGAKDLYLDYYKTIYSRMIWKMEKRYSSFKSKITIHRMGILDIYAWEYENPHVTAKRTDSSVSNNIDNNTIDLEAISRCINDIKGLNKYSVSICDYIQKMKIISITTDDIISLLNQFTEKTNPDGIVTDDEVKNFLNKIEVLNQPSTNKEKNNLKYRPFASWLIYFFNNCIIPQKYTQTCYIITNDKEFESFISDINEYRNVVEKIIPPDNLASKKKYFNHTIEYYATECITRIDTIINHYLSISENIPNNYPYKNDLLKELSGWVYQQSTPISVLFLDDDNSSRFASFKSSLLPMPLIEEKHYKKALENVKSKESWSEINIDLKKCKNSVNILHQIRYKSRELFRHYASFRPENENDFSSFSEFIRDNYNLTSYSNKIWNKAQRKK